MGENGALEAAKEARDQGLIKHIGVTGHGLKIAAFHYRSLLAFDFDSILLPWNIQLKQNPQYVSDFDRVVGLARERGIAVQIIKSLARGALGQPRPKLGQPGTSRWKTSQTSTAQSTGFSPRVICS